MHAVDIVTHLHVGLTGASLGKLDWTLRVDLLELFEWKLTWPVISTTSLITMTASTFLPIWLISGLSDLVM